MDGIHVALSAEKLGDFFGLPITNTLVTSWVVVLLLIAVGFIMGSRLQMVPGRFQTLLEWLFGGIYDYMTEVLESRNMARRFFPLLITIFLFIFVANWLEFVPGVGSIGFFYDEHEFVSLFRSVNTDLNVPLALAIISFLVVEITGIAVLGGMKYAGKFISFKSPIAFVVGLVELIGEIVRVVSLSWCSNFSSDFFKPPYLPFLRSSS